MLRLFIHHRQAHVGTYFRYPAVLLVEKEKRFKKRKKKGDKKIARKKWTSTYLWGKEVKRERAYSREYDPSSSVALRKTLMLHGGY
jgi:hypothetical protein